MFKTILSVFALLVGAQAAYALPGPLADVEKRLNLGSINGPGVQLGYQVISNKEQLLKCSYSFAKQGGASVTTIKLKAVDGTDCVLPDNAIVVGGMIDVVTAVDSPGDSAVISVSTGKAAADFKADTSQGSFTGLMTPIPVRTGATSIKMTANVNPSIRVIVSPLTAGVFNVFFQYLLSD